MTSRRILTPACVLLLAFALTGCGDPEKKRVLKTVNQHPEITQRGGHVEDIELRGADNNDPEWGYNGEVLDKDGNPIGRVRGFRVEHFGTVVRFRWNDEGEPEERRRGPRREGQGQRGPDSTE